LLAASAYYITIGSAQDTFNRRCHHKVEELALLNRLDPDLALNAGTLVKLIRPGK